MLSRVFSKVIGQNVGTQGWRKLVVLLFLFPQLFLLPFRVHMGYVVQGMVLLLFRAFGRHRDGCTDVNMIFFFLWTRLRGRAISFLRLPSDPEHKKRRLESNRLTLERLPLLWLYKATDIIYRHVSNTFVQTIEPDRSGC